MPELTVGEWLRLAIAMCDRAQVELLSIDNSHPLRYRLGDAIVALHDLRRLAGELVDG